MQLKTIEVHVNDNIELDLEYDGSYQALEGFVSEK
jgi:hypothetical protein